MPIRRQRYRTYDLVRIAADLGPEMAHFSKDQDAIVLEFDQDAGYSLYLRHSGFAAWYEEDQLTLVRSNQPKVYERWRKELGDEDDYDDL